MKRILSTPILAAENTGAYGAQASDTTIKVWAVEPVGRTRQ
ncbi:hypothetical protein [Pandoraea communis]|nr:hypothetical protein [Pandoraea communis]